MHVVRRVLAVTGAATVAFGLVALPGAASGATEAAWCQAGNSVAASAVPADFDAATCAVDDVTFVDGPAAVRMPVRGQSVSVHVTTVRGDRVLTVARALDGAVAVRRGDAAPTGPDSTASACSSSGFQRLGYHVVGSYRWSYNPANAPGSVAGAAANQIRTATSNITSGRDDCGIAGKPRTSHSYLGTTGARPNISAQPSCRSNDGRNVTGWERLNSNQILAVTCTWFRSGRVLASDVAINTRFGWANSRATCNREFDLQGVMTHERGHTYGLGHTTADQGLTMYPSVRACDFSKRTLGRGDLLGLFRIYGQA